MSFAADATCRQWKASRLLLRGYWKVWFLGKVQCICTLTFCFLDEKRINLLINNAATKQTNLRKITDDGFELHLGTNYLGKEGSCLFWLGAFWLRKPSPKALAVCSPWSEPEAASAWQLHECSMNLILVFALLGHFLLTMLLLDKLKESAPSRIVNVVDISYRK